MFLLSKGKRKGSEEREMKVPSAGEVDTKKKHDEVPQKARFKSPQTAKPGLLSSCFLLLTLK